MNSQIEEQTGSPLDSWLLLAAVALLVGSMTAFYYFAGEYNALVRALILMGGIAGAAALAYQTVAGRVMWSYIQGSRIELRKTTWPTRQESVQTTLMIALVVLIVSLLMWGLDSLLLFGVKHLTGRG